MPNLSWRISRLERECFLRTRDLAFYRKTNNSCSKSWYNSPLRQCQSSYDLYGFNRLAQYRTEAHGLLQQLAPLAHLIFELAIQLPQANASFKMRESADPRDQLISGLQARMQSLELQLRGNVIAQTSHAILDDFNQLPGSPIREDLILEVDTKPILRNAGGKIYFDISKCRTVKDLLDGIYEELDSKGSTIAPRTYKIKWILEDTDFRTKIYQHLGLFSTSGWRSSFSQRGRNFSWHAAQSNKDFK